jgi:rhodanese-related sulfurtransferase
VGPDGARRISVEDARSAIENGQAIVIDVRTEDVYNVGHIKGARSVPLAEFDKHLSEIPKDKLIITYCSWPAEHSSARAVLMLNEKGITNTAALLGGYDGWHRAGLPTEKKGDTPPAKP